MRRLELGVAGVWLAAIGGVFASAAGAGHAYSSAFARTRGFGWLTLLALGLAWSVSPASRWFADVGRATRLRRAFGLAAVGGGLIHGLCALVVTPGGIAAIWANPALRAGALALLLLSLLGLTSFPALVRRSGLRHWKELHRLAYVALPCALWHALLQPFAATTWLLTFAAYAAVLFVLRLAPKRDA